MSSSPSDTKSAPLDLSTEQELFRGALQEQLGKAFSPEILQGDLGQAVQYALFSGGKRFRPALCYGAAKALNVPVEKVHPWAVAIECIHTYSLIHDDLPCMDDDDMRRGQPTVHKKFSEATALLAGDTLLTEAFGVLSRSYQDNPELSRKLVELLVAGAGGRGMILGQVLDFAFDSEAASIDDLRQVHLLKTGQLIGLCLEGVGHIAGLDTGVTASLKKMGLDLGLAFQIKDDLLDQDKNEAQSFLRFLSFAETEQLLKTLSESLIQGLSSFGEAANSLTQLVHYNRDRDK